MQHCDRQPQHGRGSLSPERCGGHGMAHRNIEGRIIIDLDPETAVRVASKMAGAELPESDSLIRETACELANQIIGNAITFLNDQGFHFRVHPPVLHTSEEGIKGTEDTEAL